MEILRTSKEAQLASSIDYAKPTTNSAVMSSEQKDLDFDEQVLASCLEGSHLKEAIKKCSENLVNLSEKAIVSNAEPTQVDYLLRVSFWEEVSNALHEGRPIYEKSIYNGVCSQSYWKSLRETNHNKFTFLLIPIKSYSRTNKLLLTMGQEKLFQILDADPFIKGQGSGYKKQLDPRIAKVQLEAYKMVEERLHGKAVNRIQTHNINESSPGAKETIEALQREIMSLESGNTPLTIEADVE